MEFLFIRSIWKESTFELLMEVEKPLLTSTEQNAILCTLPDKAGY